MSKMSPEKNGVTMNILKKLTSFYNHLNANMFFFKTTINNTALRYETTWIVTFYVIVTKSQKDK